MARSARAETTFLHNFALGAKTPWKRPALSLSNGIRWTRARRKTYWTDRANDSEKPNQGRSR